jgi:hypothetical protein
LLFLYRNVLRQPLDRPVEALRARKPKRLPTVLTKEEALRVIGYVSGPCTLMAKLLYGSCHEIPARGPSADIMPVSVVYNGLLVRQVVRQSSPNTSVVIPFGLALQRICSSRVMISGRCKNY